MKHTVHQPHRTHVFQEHLIAFVIAVFVIGWIVWVVFYRDSLFADITRAQNPEVQQYASPLVYKIANGNLTISATKEFTKANSLTFFVMFDAKKVFLQLEKASSPYKYTYAPWLETMVQVTIFVPWAIAANTELYSVPLNGSADDITITNAGILWSNDIFETLAIQKQ